MAQENFGLEHWALDGLDKTLIVSSGEPIGEEPTRVFAPPPPPDVPTVTWTPPVISIALITTFRPAFTPLFPEADNEDQDYDEPDTRDPFSSTERG